MHHFAPSSIPLHCCRLTPDDVPALAALERRCFTLPWSEAQYTAAFTQRAFAGFGLKQGTQLVAYVAIYATGTEMEILNIAVHPEQRRQGFGRRLLRLVLRLAAKMGILDAVLEVRPSNTAALELYRGTGFVQVGRRRRYYQDTGEDALVLTLHLDRGAGIPSPPSSEQPN